MQKREYIPELPNDVVHRPVPHLDSKPTRTRVTESMKPLFFGSITWDRFGFALRTWATSVMALYIAFALQLESPYWAWLTVWIIAQPTPGMMVAKSLYLVLGTLVGAVLGILLISLFSQAPELFVLALAVLIGGCTVASNILTNFRAYGAVLTGITAGIVAANAIHAPDQVFYIAMARAAEILTGIACSMFITSIFAPHRSESKARQSLRVALQDAARRAAFSWRGSNEERLQMGRKLIFDLIALNTMIEYAAVESGEFRRQANQARSLVAHIFGLISARRSLDAHLLRCGWPKYHALEIFHEVVIDFLNEMPQQIEDGKVDQLISRIREVHVELELLAPEQEMSSSEDLISERFVIDRLDELLWHLVGALEDWQNISLGNWQKQPKLTLDFHRDLRSAWINGLRAFLAVAVTGAFWIASAWDQGSFALVFVSVLLSMFSALPHPDRVGWTMFKAGFVAVFLALICDYLILPMSSEFDFLALTLGCVLIPLGLVLSNPSTAAAASVFSLVFVNVVRPLNPMVYDLGKTLNLWVAIETGILFGTLAYVLIFPPDPLAARRYVTYRIRHGLQCLAHMVTVPAHSCRWETRMYDRVSRLNDPQNPSGTPTDEWLDAGLGALNLGNEILRLRRWLLTETLPRELRSAIEKIITAFGKFVSEPQRALLEVRDQKEEILRLDPGSGKTERRVWVRTVGTLSEMDFYLTHNPLLTKSPR